MTAVAHVDFSVQDLAGQRMRGLDARLRLLSSFTPVVRGLSWVFEGLMRRALARFHVTFKTQAIWFRGAAEEVLKFENAETPEDFPQLLARQLSAIEKVKRDILSIRAGLMESAKLFERRQMNGVAQQAISSATDLFDAIESYRWALLEIEASHAEIRDGYSATNAADLGAILDRIAAE